MSSKSGGYIEFSKLNEESIVIEEMKDFQNSIFSAVYEKAQLLLDDIVKENRKIKSKEKDMDTELLVNNVISFEGRRGTGKTSAMLSFRKSLDNYKIECAFENNCYEDRRKYREGLRFSIIDYIDASKLEQGEQILALVLANMFQKLREKDLKFLKQEEKKHQHSDLYRLFDEVYGSVLSLKDTKANCRDESPLRALTQLSNSQILQKKIRKLVKLYLSHMEEECYVYEGRTESYLVITIDDLDMYFQERGESPFEMLETLHRYLMIPGVVILLTYNSKELHLGCEKHFADIYHSKYDRLEKKDIEKQVEDIQKLSRQYLKKVLPIHMRIHMVSWKKRDYGVDSQINILLKTKEVKQYLGEFASYLLAEEKQAKGGEEQSVLLTHKKFLFLLKASKTGIFYDACGEKRHYSEAAGFRELAHEVELYKHIGNLQNENHKYKELLDGLYFRFTKEHLLLEEQEKFDEYLAVPFYRRSKDILMDLRDKCKKETGKELSLIQYSKEAEISYSYGELLYGLYEASKNRWFRKQMIWCILDSYTIMLTKYYSKMIAAKEVNDENKEKEEKNKLLRIIGASVASSWSNLLLPKWKISNKDQGSKPENETAEEGQDEEQKDIDYTVRNKETNKETDKESPRNEIKETKLQVGAVKFSQVLGFVWKFELSASSKGEELAKRLQQFEILNMFFSDVYHDSLETKIKEPGFSIKYIPGILGNQDLPRANESPRLHMQCTDACFNIMNFVHNLFRGKEFFDNLHGKLKQVYADYFQDLQKYIKEKEDKEIVEMKVKSVEEFLEEHSLYKEYETWFEETHGLAMPVYSFDMMYNVFKRYYQKRKTSHRVPDEEAVWENVKEVYRGIGERLREEDGFYYENKDNQDGKFFKYYMKSPFIEHILKPDADETFRNRFTEMLDGIRSLLVNVQ